MTEKLPIETTHSKPSPRPVVIGLSGNIAVGKSALGERLAERLGATWISETNLSMQFPHLISDKDGKSKLIAEITFAALRTAVILSHILGGCKRLVVERSLWEDWLFYELWRDRQGLQRYNSFMKQLFETLESHPLEFQLYTIVLECPVRVLTHRLSKRNLPYDHLFSDSILSDLQQRYDAIVSSRPDHIFKTVDVSTLDMANNAQVDSLLSSIVGALDDQWRAEQGMQ
jgi:deoxyadenosine/deoxycytidine kinase